MDQNSSLLLSDLISQFFRTSTNQKKDKSSFGILWRHIRPQVQSKKSIQYGGKRVRLFDSSDEEGFWGFTREDIPLRGEESDSNASGESDFSLSEASEEESSEESEDEDADETRGVEIYETR